MTDMTNEIKKTLQWALRHFYIDCQFHLLEPLHSFWKTNWCPPSSSKSALDGFAISVIGLFLVYIFQSFLTTSASLKQRRDGGKRNVFFREFGCLETVSELEFDRCIQRSELIIVITSADFFFSLARNYIYNYIYDNNTIQYSKYSNKKNNCNHPVVVNIT